MSDRLAAAVAVVALAVTLVGCGAAGTAAPVRSTTAGGSAAGGADVSSYVTKAHLDPCPAATGTRQGGLHPLTLSCLGGGPDVDLSRLRGPALVNMWASWCEPCVREVPFLEQLHAATKGRLLVLGVDIEESSRRSPLAFAAAVGMRYPSLYDPDGAFRSAENVPAPPATLFVDPAGRVVHRSIGYYHSAAQLRAAVTRYLGVRT